MTLERASELVGGLRKSYPSPDTKAQELFEYFVNAFEMSSLDEIEMFAVMCGYKVARSVRPVDPEMN